MTVFEDAWDTLEDGVEWVADRYEDAYEWAEEAVEGFEEWLGEAIDDIGDYASDAGDLASDAWDGAKDVYEAAGDAASAVLDPVFESVLSPIGDTLLGGLEDTGFFDVVDYATVGLVDVSYGDNGFSANFGIEDVFGAGFNVGNGGFGAQYSFAGQHLGGSWNDDGFSASAALGLDWGPLPYVEGRASVEADGDLGAGGEWQGYFPLPGGMVGGRVSGDYQETDDGFKTEWDLTPGVYQPTGQYVGIGTHGSYSESKDGYDLNLGLHAEAGQEGVINVRGSLDYDETRHGDVRTQGVSASARVEEEYSGTTVEGRVGYQHTETPDGDYDSLYVEGKARVADVEFGAKASGTVGPDGELTVAGSGHVRGEGFEIGAHGSVTAGPDGVTADGGVDQFKTPYELPTDAPSLDDLPIPRGLPELPDLPSLPEMPELPDMPDAPSVPDFRSFPDAPANSPSDDDPLPF